MSSVQRLGLLLLGLLLLAGVVHAPLHHDGQDCGTFALCSNGFALMWNTGFVALLLLLGNVGRCFQATFFLPSQGFAWVGCGRAPPR